MRLNKSNLNPVLGRVYYRLKKNTRLKIHCNQVHNQVYNQVGDQVWNQLWGFQQVIDQVTVQVWDQIRKPNTYET